MELKVSNFTQNNLAVSAAEGALLCEKIRGVLDKAGHVVVNFENIQLTISAFLNTAIGQLYAYYPPEFIKERVEVINLQNDERQILAMVIDQAKKQLSNKKKLPDNTDLVDE